jgi:EAL domain-containing protein (putative c-di-GMP-specific phosphodiesterase class I)
MAGFIAAALADADVAGERLVLAIAEAKVFTNLRAAQDFASAIAGFGARTALEKFGAGLNSLQLLQHFDPTFLKLDPQFMDDLGKNAESQKQIRNLASQAATRNIRTIAERVEDASSMTMLFSAGIDYVQGDFLAPAGPDMNYDFS